VRGIRLAVVAMAVGALSLASSARASDFTWSGAARTPTWSEGTNWVGGAAPNGAVGVLDFPLLSAGGCAASPPTGTCYATTNDTSVKASGITVDDGVGYVVGGNAILLGAGGLTASTAASDPAPVDGSLPTLTFSAPLVLQAPQTWSITGGSIDPQVLVGGMVSGAASATLAIELSEPSNVAFAAANVGPVTVTGDGDPQDGDIELGNFDQTGALAPGSLNAGDEEPVSFTAGAGLFALAGTIGPLSMASGIVQVGEPDQAGTLRVAGAASIDAQSELLEYINGPGTTAGSDYSQLAATSVNLAGSSLVLGDGEAANSTACEQLRVGDVDTLITTTGLVTGTFAGIPDGMLVSLHCFGSGGTPPTVTIHYTGTAVTATVVTAGTPAAASSTTVGADPASPVTNQPVTLTAAVTSGGSAAPTGTVEFDAEIAGATAPIRGCAAQGVSPAGSSFTATCTTSFAATDAPTVSASFAAADGSAVAGSSSAPLAVAVVPAPTTTAVSIAPASVGIGQPTVYTATVTPAYAGGATPSGSVGFLVNGQPPAAGTGGSAGCTALKLPAGAASPAVACQEVFAGGTGTVSLAVTATYGGDANFTASTSPPQTVTVAGPPVAPGGPAKAVPGIGRAAFGRANVSATIADLVVSCAGSAGQTCSVTLRLSTRETTKRGKVVGASAAAGRATTRTVSVGARTLAVRAGLGEVVHLKLNAAGRRLLARLRRLPVALSATQRTSRGTSRPTVRRIAFRALPAKA
jgi:hypothetical protein